MGTASRSIDMAAVSRTQNRRQTRNKRRVGGWGVSGCRCLSSFIFNQRFCPSDFFAVEEVFAVFALLSQRLQVCLLPAAKFGIAGSAKTSRIRTSTLHSSAGTMSRALLRGPWCHACRQDVLQSFVTISGVSISPAVSPLRPLYDPRRRALSSAPRLRSDNLSSCSGAGVDAPSTEDNGNKRETPQHIPWYLQVETPASAEPHPLAHRQQIPPLPEDPPPMLEDLLKHISVEIGLDDLTLLDLRGLDPPPALGGNVIMIIGTARSVKHLNVSADRLCRWLRSTYKLRPYADGLLGRNELKLKLRRQARKARIASKAGVVLDNKDDGITTGWICVNAGIVDDGKISQEQRLREEGFEGFGKIAGGTRIVVQMFTEEKRAEIDLEGLWGAALERQRRGVQRAPEAAPDTPLEEVRAPSAMTSESSSEPDTGPVLRPPTSIFLDQKRGFHTSARRLEVACSEVKNETTQDDAGRGSGTPAQGDKSAERKYTIPLLFRYLEEIPESRARDELGNGPDDHDSTPFLRLFYDNKAPGSDVSEMAAARMRLMCFAISLQHPAYSKERLWEVFQEYVHCGYPLPDSLGLEVVSALLTARPPDPSAGERTHVLPDSDKELALRVLDHLSLQGTDVLNMTVFKMLYKAAHFATPATEGKVDGATSSSNADKRESRIARVKRVMDALNIPFDAEQARELMVFHFRNEDYDGFWKLWRKFPMYGLRRSSEDYALIFRLHAELGDQRRARDCVSTWVPMMGREEPPVPLQGEVARQIMSCIEAADPFVEERALEGSINVLPMIYNYCRQALQREESDAESAGLTQRT